MPGALAATDVKGRQIFVNPAFCRLVGMSEAELLGMGPPYPYWAPEDAPAIGEQFQRMLGRERPEACEFALHFVHKNGKRFPVRVRTAPLADSALEGWAILVEDQQPITEVKESLREREHFIETVMWAAPEIIYVYDIREHRVVYTNRNVANPLGFTAQQVRDMGSQVLTTLLHPDDFKRLPELFARWDTAKDGQVLESEYRLRAADGQYRWFLGRDTVFQRDEHGVVIQLIGAARDNSARKQAEEARDETERHLRDSESRYRLLADHATDMISRHSSTGTYRDVSPACARLLGFTPHELIGRSGYELIYPADRDQVFHFHVKMIEDKKPQTIVCRFRRKDGAFIWIETNAQPILDPATGEVAEILAVTRDISDRLALEEQLRQAQKMEAINQLAGGIAHDFNNILTAIMGNVAVLVEDVPVGDSRLELLSAIDKAANRAAQLTNRLLVYSRRSTIHLRPTDINRVIRDTLSLLRPTFDPRIVFEFNADPAAWPIMADGDQVEQVITNICLNSRDAMPRGGRLSVAAVNVTAMADSATPAAASLPGNYVRLTVADTGAGMTSQVLSHVFEPFFTTKPTGAGTGLGLAMVYGIVKSHGGWVNCESEPGAGTRMDVYWPRSEQPEEQPLLPDKLTAAKDQKATGATVLLVDDESTIRTLGRHILEKNGYRVLLAEDGVDAIETFREVADQLTLVILDMTMPRMSGPDTFRLLREIKPGVRVLFSSGYSAELLDLADLGAGFIGKPYRPAELLEAVRAQIACDAV